MQRTLNDLAEWAWLPAYPYDPLLTSSRKMM